MNLEFMNDYRSLKNYTLHIIGIYVSLNKGAHKFDLSHEPKFELDKYAK